jgi:glycine/D-amino acid oxidase-like deaminating enzyme/nitrite reductase/ring-hydroxylating ferredoxin subunit
MSQSIWRAIGVQPITTPLISDAEVDVVIVGAGITGLTLALLMLEHNRRVVVLEAAEIGSGTTGHSTCNLYEDVGDTHFVSDRWGMDVMRQVITARHAAIDWIESTASRLAIECAFRRCPKMICAVDPDAAARIERTRRAWLDAGLVVTDGAFPAEFGTAARPCIALAGQAQFHAVAWVIGLAREVLSRGGVIAQHAPATQIDYDNRFVMTPSARISAEHLVLATHSPKGFHPVQAEMPVHREYAAAWRLPAALPAGIFWLLGDEITSMRGLEVAEQAWLIVVGSPYQTGLHEASHAQNKLMEAAQRRFNVKEPEFTWSAQNYQGADGLPYIGRSPSGALVATGFKTDGLTWGTVAAHAVADEILGRDNPVLDLCNPSRFSPIKGREAMAHETTTTIKAFVRDYVTAREIEDVVKLQPGSGALVKLADETAAAYRDREGALVAVSPVCTHLGCRVHWNDIEKSWDCPCHGSRFTPEGEVIEGPAIRPLKRLVVTAN